MYAVIALVGILAFCLGIRLRLAGQERLHGVVYILFMFFLGAGTAYIFQKSDKIIPWPLFLSMFFAAVAAGYVGGWIWNVRFSRSAMTAGFKIAILRFFSDFRIAAILIGLLISCLLTFYFAKIASQPDPTGFWIAFYAAWVSGLLFFTVVGLIAGFVTLYRPERDVFLARVKILLGGMSGPIVDYIASEVRRIGYSAEKTTRVITIEDFIEADNRFKVRVAHTSRLRNVLRDVAASAGGKIAIKPDKFPAALSPVGQLTSFRINDAGQPGLPADIGPGEFRRDWTLSVEPGATGDVEYEHWYWYSGTEKHTFELSRFTEELSIEFRCRCRPSNKRLLLKLTTPTESSEHTLDWDGEYCFTLRDQLPGTKPYAFELGLGP